MYNTSKLILLNNLKKKKRNKKPYVVTDISSEKFVIQSKELDKLKNPLKGQIFVHFVNDNDIHFFRFTGKEWIEIK